MDFLHMLIHFLKRIEFRITFSTNIICIFWRCHTIIATNFVILSFSTNWIVDKDICGRRRKCFLHLLGMPVSSVEVKIKRKLIKNNFPYECEPVCTSLISFFIDSVTTAINLALILIRLSHFQQ